MIGEISVDVVSIWTCDLFSDFLRLQPSKINGIRCVGSAWSARVQRIENYRNWLITFGWRWIWKILATMMIAINRWKSVKMNEKSMKINAKSIENQRRSITWLTCCPGSNVFQIHLQPKVISRLGWFLVHGTRAERALPTHLIPLLFDGWSLRKSLKYIMSK